MTPLSSHFSLWAGAERGRGVSLYSVGCCQTLPAIQERFWMSTAAAIINSLTSHFHSLSPQSAVALELQSPNTWSGVTISQLVCRRGVFSSHHRITECMVGSTVRGPCFYIWQHRCAYFAEPIPQHCNGPSVGPIPVWPSCARAGHHSSTGRGQSFACVSESNGCFAPIPLALLPMVTKHLCLRQFNSLKEVRRLTRYVEMSLDTYYARLNRTVSQGRFKHIGRATFRLEGATAWGVWLRIDQWSTGGGNRPRLRCGALFHVASRTVSLHGAARDAVRFLLPIFENWTVATMSQLSSVQQDQIHDVAHPPLEPALHGDQYVAAVACIGQGPTEVDDAPAH